MKKEVMVTAWEIAREAVVEFGGKAVEYLSGALKMAWAKIKGGAKMKGSEKQVAWAEKIKAEVIRHIDKFNDLNNNLPSKEDKDYYTKANALSAQRSILFGNDHKESVREQSLIQDILKQDDASYWIDNFKFLV